MKNFVRDGSNFPVFLDKDAIVRGGDVVILHDLVGVAIGDSFKANSRTQVVVATEGIFDLPVEGDITPYKKAYFNPASKALSLASTAGKAIGYFVSDAVGGRAHVRICHV